MTRRNKHKKAGQKLISIRTKGGITRKPDLSIDPDEDQPHAYLPNLARHVKTSSYQLAMEYEEVVEELGLRIVASDAFVHELVEQLSARQVSETHLMNCFDGSVLIPLQRLYDKLAELHTKIRRSEQKEARTLIRHAASEHEGNFGQILAAFEAKVEGILKLNQEDISYRESICKVLEETNRCADRGEQIKSRIVGSQLPNGTQQLGIEQTLDDLVRQTARDLSNEKEPLCTREELERRWEELENLLESYRRAKSNFAAASEEYSTRARAFFNEHDALSLYKSEWHRQKETIRYAEEFFKAASFDPFVLSEKLAEVERDDVLTMPDQEERALLEARTPDPFPRLPERRLEERVEKTLKEVVAAVEAFNKPPTKPPAACPVSLAELALCTYAAFVARYSNGRPYPTSGRTIRKVYTAMLTPAQLTYDCTEEDFQSAVKEAESAGWLQCFKRARGNHWHYCYQPTVNGFTVAEKLSVRLPADFRERIFGQHEALRAENDRFRQQLKEKKQQT